MNGRSADRPGAEFGAAEMVVRRVGARASRGVGDAVLRRGWQRWGRGGGARRHGWSVVRSRRCPGGSCAVVAVIMDDFRRSWWCGRGAEDTAELRNTVVFSTIVIHLFRNAKLVNKEGMRQDGVSTAEGGRSASSDCATKTSLQMFSVCAVGDEVVT
jgi:hypothetical protein